jgi:LAO/AO transport system kinase
MPSSVDISALFDGDRRVLAKAITLIESARDEDQREAEKLLEAVLPRTGGSFRIGVTGAPGVGKSTFIDGLGLHVAELGHKVAVLAVDPSSALGGGSILGDKVRMERLARHSSAFIRPSPAAAALGGIAERTREALLLCEAAGFDVVIVETVGVGQSEYDVASMVDFFLVLLLPNSGDELQGIKRGIMELADAVVVNKADGEAIAQAERTRSQYLGALNLLRHGAGWKPRVATCSALHNEGLDRVWEMATEFRTAVSSADSLAQKRAAQNLEWLKKLVHETVTKRLYAEHGIEELVRALERDVREGRTTPLSAVRELRNAIDERARTRS